MEYLQDFFTNFYGKQCSKLALNNLTSLSSQPCAATLPLENRLQLWLASNQENTAKGIGCHRQVKKNVSSLYVASTLFIALLSFHTLKMQASMLERFSSQGTKS